MAMKKGSSQVILTMTFACLIGAGITSSEAAVARSQSPQRGAGQPSNNRNNAIMDPAFANAGQRAGLEIWRVEDFKPVPYPKDQYGKFYTGDSYIVLNTNVNKRGDKSWDIHFWLGAETSQDEAGAAAILAVQLDELLGGAPIQHRERQEHESQLFLSYFKSGVRYQPGGVSSGFRHVNPEEAETRLFQVKGSRNIRVKEVDPNLSSMNKGDCFILDTGKKIYVYVGASAKRIEKIKATTAANQIRDQDHAGKSKVIIVDEFSPQSDYDEFFGALGGGSRDKVPDATVGGDDAQFETQEERAAALYRVSDSSGAVRVEPVGQRPLQPALLDEGDVFILDSGSTDVFVWVGRRASPQEKKESLKKADAYLKETRRPSWTHVERIVQGSEPAAFTQFFRSWQGVGEMRPRLTRSASNPRLFHATLRPGASKFQVVEVYDFEQDDLNQDDVMFLDDPNSNTVFLWIGSKTDAEEKARSKEVVEKYLADHHREDTKVVVFEQGEEGEQFKGLFREWNPDLWQIQVDLRQLAKRFN
ncbi:actin depolymerising venom protein gelsolin 1 [Anthonomus grandis grandis]|uniref:actin depolymerising venom protein gelsolin 1 n=1 Tax=Anthonomus grandis grandis TaxID=2921223 RepID=UPI0021669C22|nr:actin depolymerising venom protein gelsolin 1 [Anthonomus grandis grandis]